MKTIQLVIDGSLGESVLYETLADYIYISIDKMRYPIVLSPGQNIRCEEAKPRKHHYY